MPAYVRLKDHGLLRAAMDRLSRAEGRQITQAEVGTRAGLSTQRISQLATGVAPVIRASHAAQLEDVFAVIGVVRGDLFTIEEPELLREYLNGLLDKPDDDEPDPGQSTQE